MRLLKSFIILTLGIISFHSTAQITQGHVTYKIEATASTEEMKMAVSMLDNSKLELYFNDNQSRTEFDMGMMNTVTITNKTADKIMILMDVLGMKIAIQSSISELQEQTEEKDNPLKVELVNETKKILNYTCKKAIVVSDSTQTIIWYTESVKVPADGQELFHKEVPGLPMAFEVNSEGLILHFEVISLDEKLDSNEKELFNFDLPEGYNLMTEEELKQIGM